MKKGLRVAAAAAGLLLSAPATARAAATLDDMLRSQMSECQTIAVEIEQMAWGQNPAYTKRMHANAADRIFGTCAYAAGENADQIDFARYKPGPKLDACVARYQQPMTDPQTMLTRAGRVFLCMSAGRR